MSKEEFDFINDLFSILTKNAPIPDIVIFLDVPTKELSRRMDKRGRIADREHEKLYTNEYLKQLNIGLLEYVEKMKQAGKTVIVYNQSKNTIASFGVVSVKLEKLILKLIHSLDH